MATIGLRANGGGGCIELLGRAPDPQRQDTIIVLVGESERGSDDSAFVGVMSGDAEEAPRVELCDPLVLPKFEVLPRSTLPMDRGRRSEGPSHHPTATGTEAGHSGSSPPWRGHPAGWQRATV